MANAQIPVIERKEHAEAVGTPDFANAMRDYADASNSMSAIGAAVAQKSSNAMAVELGYESGKTPHGNLSPSFTDFDKTFADSYHTQAMSTLSLQAEDLMTKSEIEMSKPMRLSPGLIAQTQAQLSTALKAIAAQAPTAIKGKLEETFASQLLRQNEQYNKKMISQQHEDTRNHYTNAIEVKTKNALELSSSGDFAAGEEAAKQAAQMAESAKNSSYFDEHEARVASESAKQAHLNGMVINGAVQAQKAGVENQYKQQYANKTPKELGMTNEQYYAAGQAMEQHISFLDNLRSQQEHVVVAQMMNNIATNPTVITGGQMAALQSQVTPLEYEQVKLAHINALKAWKTSEGEANSLVMNWKSPDAFALASEKTKNAGYVQLVNATMEDAKKNGNQMSLDDAQVQVAMSAGGSVPGFVNTVENKLKSANPNFIESGAQQYHKLLQLGAGRALDKLSDESKAIMAGYETLRNSTDPATAAREVTDRVMNQDPAMRDANKEAWSQKIHEVTKFGTSLTNYTFSTFDMKESDFVNPSMAHIYATDILEKYGHNYQLLNRDDVAAKKVTKQWIDENYGDTAVNGGMYKTLHPIEKELGYKGHDVVPFIHQDLKNQLSLHFMPGSLSYANKETKEFWDVVPSENKAPGFFSSSKPVQVAHHRMVGNKEVTEKYDVVLIGNSYGSYDVSLSSNNGMQPIFHVAPYVGFSTYIPNKKDIDALYAKAHS